MSTYKRAIFVLILFLTTGCSLYAGSPDLNVIPKAKALSLNGLYFAGNDGMNSVLSNPAALILQNSGYLEMSISDLIGQQEFKGDVQGLHKSFEEDHFTINGGFGWAFSPDLMMGISYQRAINYNVNWPFIAIQNSDSSSSIAAFDFYNRIIVNAASLTGAVRFGEISLGVSLNAYQVKQESAFPRVNPLWYDTSSVGAASYQFNYDEDAWTFGFNAGISYKVSDDMQLGIMTRSGYSADLSGTARSDMFYELDSVTAVKVDLSSKFEMPWVFGGGVVYNLLDNLKLNADFQYSLWGSTQKSINFKYNNSYWQNRLASSDSLTGSRGDKFTLNFNNTVDAGIGLEYLLTDLDLRLGYRYSQSPNSASTYSYFFPSVDQHWVSLGIGYKDENLSADLGLAYAFGVSKSIQNSKTGFNGTYDSDIVLPTITIRYAL